MDKQGVNGSTGEVKAQQEREQVLKAMILEPKSRWYWYKQPLRCDHSCSDLPCS